MSERVTNKHTMNKSRREFVQIRTRILDKAHNQKLWEEERRDFVEKEDSKVCTDGLTKAFC